MGRRPLLTNRKESWQHNQYNPNIPQPTDLLSNSQPQLLVNFQSLQAWIDVNHVDYDDNLGNAGKHLYVVCPDTASYPAPSPFPFNTTDTGFYNNTAYSSAFTNSMWFHPAGLNTAFNDFPISDGILDKTGWSFLPSGLFVLWGSATMTTPLLKQQFFFPTTSGGLSIPPFAQAPYFMLTQLQQATMVGNLSYSIGISSVTTTSFYAVNSIDGDNSVNFYWVAVGNVVP